MLTTDGLQLRQGAWEARGGVKPWVRGRRGRTQAHWPMPQAATAWPGGPLLSTSPSGSTLQPRQVYRSWHPRVLLEQLNGQHLVRRQLAHVRQRRLHSRHSGHSRVRVRRRRLRTAGRAVQCRHAWAQCREDAWSSSMAQPPHLVLHGGWHRLCCCCRRSVMPTKQAAARHLERSGRPGPRGRCQQRRGCRAAQHKAAHQAGAAAAVGACARRSICADQSAVLPRVSLHDEPPLLSQGLVARRAACARVGARAGSQHSQRSPG